MGLKCRYFTTATDLQIFVNDAASAVGAIVSITFDATSSKYVLFYT